jgi:hypothetical protein
LNIKKTFITSKLPNDYSSSSINESNTYPCEIVVNFLLKLYKSFANDLIRKTCSDIYTEKTQLPLTLSKKNNQKNSIDLYNNKFPIELGVVDIYKTIMKHNKFDFLTNKYLALPNSSIQQKSTTTPPTQSSSSSSSHLDKAQTDNDVNSEFIKNDLEKNSNQQQYSSNINSHLDKIAHINNEIISRNEIIDSIKTSFLTKRNSSNSSNSIK